MQALDASDPRTVGSYQLLRRLGSGGMGRVYLGRSSSGRTVAIKLVHQELAASPEFRRRFAREVAAARQVGGRWTAPVLDSDTESSVPWVATGYVPGPALSDVVAASHGPLPEPTVWALVHGLSQALTEIHRNGLVHRDLKPSNILVTLDGPKVIDFGIARAVDASMMTRTGSVIGSPGYMAPEQVRGEQVTPAADVFALGAVLVHAATTVGPFADGEPTLHVLIYRILHEEAQLGSPGGPLRGELRQLAHRCLIKDPARRPALEDIAEIAARHVGDRLDTGLWLPPALTAQLGRDVAQLLELESPNAEPAPAVPSQSPQSSLGTPPPSQSPLGTPPPQPPLATPPPQGFQGTPPQSFPVGPPPAHPTTPPQPPSLTPLAPLAPLTPATRPPTVVANRRRRYLAIGAAALSLVAVATLIVVLTRDGDGKESTAGRGETTGPSDPTELQSQSPPATEPATEPEPEQRGDPGAPLYHLLPPVVKRAGEIQVMAAPAARPFSYRDQGGKVAGVEADLLEEVGELLGVKVAFEQSPDFETMLPRLATKVASSGTPVIAIGGFADDPTVRGKNNLNFVNHYQEGSILLTKGDDAVKSLTDVCGGIVVSWNADYFRDLVQKESADCDSPVKFDPGADIADMLRTVNTGAADAALVPYSAVVDHLNTYEGGDDGWALTAEQLGVGPHGIAVPETYTHLDEAIQAALRRLIAGGTYTELLDEWGIPNVALKTPTINAAH